MEFRRIPGLPPYVFAIIDGLKIEARRAGIDVIDLGFGNPDIPSPEIAVEKLAEAVQNPRNHRYSASRGIPKLRAAICDLYLRKFGVELDPETEACTSIGAKEGFSHLMWVLLGSGDTKGLVTQASETLKSFKRAVSRIPRQFTRTWGAMIAAITASWKYQLVSDPKTGTSVSAGMPRTRVAAPIR